MISSNRFESTNFNTVVNPSRDSLLEAYVKGACEENFVLKYQELYNFDFPWRTYHVGLVDAGGYFGDAGIKKGARSLVDACVAGNFYGYTFETDNYIGILFRDASLISLPRILKLIQGKVREAFGITVSISVGSQADSPGLLPRSYLHAVRLLDQKFLYGNKQIVIKTEDTAAGNEIGGSLDLHGLCEDLYCAIGVNNVVAVNNLLEEMKNMQIRRRLDESIIRANYEYLYRNLLDKLCSGCPAAGRYTAERERVLGEMAEKSSLQELHGYMKFKLLSISGDLYGNIKQDDMIEKVVGYIGRNYSRDIKLESIAGLFGYNSTYLGKLFKSRTGSYFNAYLDQVRLDTAKRLLGEGLKVYQAAERVGIGDIDYFYKKFKKYTGLSPSAFKGKTG